MSSASNSKPTRQPRHFPVNTLSLLAATLALAVFGSVGWVVSLYEVSPALALLMAAVFLTAPLLAAATASLYPHLSAAMKCVAVLVIVSCSSMDVISNVRSFVVIEEAARKATIESQLFLLMEERTSATARLAAAEEALANVPDPSATGEIRNRDTWNDVMDRRTEERDNAQAALQALKDDTVELPPSIIPLELVWTIFTAFTAAIVLGWSLLASAKQSANAATESTDEQDHPDVRVEYLQLELKKARSQLYHTRKDRKAIERELVAARRGPQLVATRS